VCYALFERLAYLSIGRQVGGDTALRAAISTGGNAHDLDLAWVWCSATSSARVDNGASSNHGGAEDSDEGTHDDGCGGGCLETSCLEQ